MRAVGYGIALSLFLPGLLLLAPQRLRPWLRKLPRYFRRRDVTIQLTGQTAQVTAGTFRKVNVSDIWSLAPSSRRPT